MRKSCCNRLFGGFRLAVLGMLLTATWVAWGNGGPVIESSSLTLARTPVARHVPEVQLVNEHLTFTPLGRYTLVEVRYTLRNQSDKHLRDIPYGFPIDYYGSGPCHTEMWGFWEGDGWDHALGWSDDYIRDVAFALNGKPMSHRCSADTIIRPRRDVMGYYQSLPQDIINKYLAEAKESNEDYFDSLKPRGLAEIVLNENEHLMLGEYETEISRRWYYTHLSIAPHQEVELVVRYRLFNYGESYDTDHGDVFSPLDCYRNFTYDFAPAAYWGNGKVGHIDVDVCDRYCASHDKQWSKPNYPFAEVAPRLIRWSGDEVDLASLEPLNYIFDGYRHTWHQYRQQRLKPNQYEVQVSGVDVRYPVANMSDTNTATAAVLRPDGKGSTYIRIRLKKPQVLAGLVIVGGYAKSRATWTNNCRIKALKATLYDEKGKPVDIQDYRLMEKKWEPVNKDIDSLYYQKGTRLDEPYDLQRLTREHLCIEIPLSQEVEWQLPTGRNTYPFFEGVPFRPTISEILLEVTEQEPGTKYNDLCVSEIVVLGE